MQQDRSDRRGLLSHARERGRDRGVVCGVCQRLCLLGEGEQGPCGTRRVDGGELLASRPGIGRALALPIESMGFYHVLPGSRVLAVALDHGPTVQQPWSGRLARTGKGRASLCHPDELVRMARSRSCDSLLFAWTDPAYHLETVLEALQIARRTGLLGLVHTCGSMTREAVDLLAPVVGAAQVLVPTLTDRTARRSGGVGPHVLRASLTRLRSRGVWVEATTTLVPGFNDSQRELSEVAASLAAIDGAIPWHVVVAEEFPWFHDLPATDAGLERARRAAEQAGLDNFYAAGMPELDQDFTFCPGCRDEVLIERFLGRPTTRLDAGGCCPRCRTRLGGLFSEPVVLL